MKSNYKKLGPYIQELIVKNKGVEVGKLLGVSITKQFIPSIANTVGTDMSKYKIVRTNQFSYGPVTSRNGDKVSVALLQEEGCIVSTSYTVFEIIDKKELDPEYLMMWFRRPEFDRYARFKSHGSVREIFGWDEMCDIELPMPDIRKQREIVREYNIIVDRIKLNEQFNQKLEETAQAIYKQWFVDFEFPNTNDAKLVDSGHDEFGLIPEYWKVLSLQNITSKIGSGSTPRGGKNSYKKDGISLVRSLNVFDYNFKYKDLAFIDELQAKKLINVELKENDILINITGVSVSRCCIVPKDILPARVNQHVAIIRPIKNTYLYHYLLCAFCSTDYKSRLLGVSEGGSTRQALTKNDLEDSLVLLPDLNTLTLFENKIKQIFKFKHKLTLENQILLRTKELLLTKNSRIVA